MSDLISRQAALDTISTAELGCEYDAIKALPSAERPKGKWIEADLNKDFVACSVCKNAGYKDRMAWRPDYAKRYFNYCPNCGAEMESEE